VIEPTSFVLGVIIGYAFCFGMTLLHDVMMRRLEDRILKRIRQVFGGDKP
jgi:hypothetical protein